MFGTLTKNVIMDNWNDTSIITVNWDCIRAINSYIL